MRILIPLLLAFFLASVFVARGQQARAATAQMGAQAAQSEARELDALAQRVRQVAGRMSDDPHADKPVERALAETVSATMERRIDDAITIETLTVASGGGVTRVSPVAEMAQPVPMSGGQLRAVSVRVKGSYGNYQGLRDYVASFRDLPVAVTTFNASERSFELTLTVFGR